MSADGPTSVAGALDAQLRGLVGEESRVAGALARIERGDGTLLWEGAAGRSRADVDAMLSPADRFHVASITKTMTAVLVLQHAERGAFGAAGVDARLADLGVLDSAVIDRLSRIGAQSHGRAITLRHLLTHTAGIRDAMVDDAQQLGGPAPGSLVGRMLGPGGDPHRHWSPWDPARPGDAEAGVVNFYLNSGLADSALAPPGQSFRYSDTGFMLLGLAVEHAGAEPLHAQLRERIFDLLGLDDTYLAYRGDPPGMDATRRPESDCWAGTTPCLSTGVSLSFDWAGGGVVSSARSLIAFERALLAGRLFARRGTLHAMLDWRVPQGLAPPRSGVGLGLFRIDSTAGPLIGHSGAWGAHMYYSPTLDLYLAGTVNQSAAASDWHWRLLVTAGAAAAHTIPATAGDHR